MVKQNAASAVLNRIPVSADVMIWTVMNMQRSAKNMKLIDADKLKEAINSSLNTGRETFSPEIIREGKDISTMFTREENKKNGRLGYCHATREKDTIISPSQYGAFFAEKR